MDINDIIKIVYISDNLTYDITDNYYILDKRYKKPGRYNLMLNKEQILLIKETIIDEQLYKLNDSSKYVKSCRTVCLSEIILQYKSGRKQHFIFDNYNYIDNFNNKSYRKIINLEKIIMKIIMTNVEEPQPIKVYL